MNKTLSLTFCLLFALILLSCASKAPAYNQDSSTSYEMAGKGFSEASRVRSETTERMVAYNAYVNLSVKNTEETKKTLSEQVAACNGFITTESNNQITARIPTENMDTYIEQAKKLGKVESESKTGRDITDQYRDNVTRLENLKSVRATYLSLLDKAVNVTEMISIEKELERVNTEIELLEGRIKYAQESVAYSSIQVRFNEKAKPGPVGWVFYGLYCGVKWLFIWD